MFRERYTVDDNGCWLWQGFIDADGYAQCSVNNKTTRVHRHHYELKHGPIPKGMQLDHRCRVRSCVNPDHVEPVTGAINTQRKSNAKLIPEQVLEIRARYAKGEKQQKLADEFKVSNGHISWIVNRLTWRNI